MNKLTLFISAFILVILNVSHAWALPNCVGSFSTSTWNNCFGTYNWDNGDKYVGEFKDGLFSGQGTYSYANGNKYVGAYKNGEANGQGTITFANGNKYVGNVKDGKRTGPGTFTFADGSKWVGEWENDNLNGYAITYKADGSISQEGIFKDDVFQYAQKKSKLDKHKDTCKEIGFTPKTESFGNCVLKLMDRD